MSTHRRLVRFVATAALVASVAVTAAACNGSTAGDGKLDPPSTTTTAKK